MVQIRFFIIFILLTFVISCKEEPQGKVTEEDLSTLRYNGSKSMVNSVVIHELSDPDKLNPLTSQGAGATYIEHNIFMYLLDVDKEKFEPIPWLAKSRPVITEILKGEYQGGLKIDYEIKEEAKWDNGSTITGHDVDFSFKTVMNPNVDSEHQRSYIDFVKEIKIDKNNPKKFSLFTKEKNYAAEFSTGGTIYIIPEYIYDKEGVMKRYTLKQLTNKESLNVIRENRDLETFAREFNSENFQREEVIGCGPYEFLSWKTGTRIILKKKENWWGNKFAGIKSFENYPEKLTYEIINDKVTAITAMRDESIDIMRGIRPSDFEKLKNNKSFNGKYFLKNPESLSYTYIGINTKNEILKENKVRKALAHLVDVKKIIKILRYGYAKEISSFVHPSKMHFNKKLKPFPFDLKEASKLLDEAGWSQKDSDGVRIKMVNGEKQRLSFSIKYNSGNDTRETISLFLQENAKKVGMEISIIAREWSVYLEECKNHEFDLYVLGWIQEAILNDPKQLFHTNSFNGGSNYTGFGDDRSDKLIESIRKEMDEGKRIEMLKELQKIIQDEVPYIFLYAPDNLLALSKRFGASKTYIARPGYDERESKLAPFK